MSGQHAKFLARLEGSNPGRFAFAYWLNEQGYTVELPPTKKAPTAAEHRKFADKGDVFAWEENGPRLRIEVKTLGVNFTGKADWPFREVFVSSVRTVARAFMDVFAWVSVSQDLRAAVVVEGTTFESWYVVKVPVSNTGNVESNYAAPLLQAKFFSLDCAPKGGG